MLFWIIAAALTLAASLTVLVPLTRRTERAASGNANDIEVYRDQLSELDRDAARGLIAKTEAEEARAEIGRRILRAADESQAKQSPTASGLARMLGAAAVLAIPLVSWGLYSEVGSPSLPGQPLSARLAEDPASVSMQDLVARAEGHLVTYPEDGRGWDVLAPIYQRAGRLDDAVAAYRNAIRLLEPNAERLSGLGEALAYAAGGVVTPEAKASFEQATGLDPKNAKARFYLAALLAQDGDFAQAADAWRAMVPDLPPDSPWRSAVDGAIAEAEARQGKAPATASASGPTQQDVDAAASMPDGDRNAMIASMVDGLDAKLRQNPRDLEGWLRLVRSYVVIGKSSEALDALDRGLTAFDSDQAATGQLQALAASLGLEATRKE